MADIKVVYKNADGFDNEHNEATDSVKMLSFKTANNELTDSKLGALVGGGDASSQHHHDGIYFRESEFINATTGVADAAKPIKTNAAGKVDPSFIDLSTLDHGTLSGLGDDDHTQYLKTDGTRDITGVQKYASLVAISDDKALAHKKYVDDAIIAAELGNEWMESAQIRSITPPGSPSIGDRVLIDGTLGAATGAFAGKEDQVAQWDGSAWIFTMPLKGTFISVDTDTTVLYYYGGTAWSTKAFESTTASTGLVKVGMDIRLDSSAAGDGLGFASGVLSVNVDGSSLEINADSLRVKALGIKDTMIDFGTGAGQVSAVDMPIADANNVITATEVEGALQELAFQDLGAPFIAGENLVKGDLVYVSANNTVSKLSNISSNAVALGLISNASVSTGGVARVRTLGKLLTGILSGATAGQAIYWTGSGFSATQPSTSGQNVWRVGVAKNATDLYSKVEHIKKNA